MTAIASYFTPLMARVTPYERQLSAGAMVLGFATDNYFYGRIDHPRTQAIFAFYIVLAAVSIAALHFVESRVQRGDTYPRWRSLLPMATQFALGCLWSAFLIFYSRSAVISNAWPFLAILALILVAHELIKTKRSRLVLSNVLFFFALFSYAIFVVPMLTGSIGMATFILSGGITLAIFALFFSSLAYIGPERFRQIWKKVALGAAGVFVLLNGFYFANILPPLPLALSDSGVYHRVKKIGDMYSAVAEMQPWQVRLGYAQTLHIVQGEPVYFYSAVFAPIQLSTSIVHRWQRYDPDKKVWKDTDNIIFKVNGGRDGGYRGYTLKTRPQPGVWRVDIDTMDGRLIGRVNFEVEAVPQAGPRETITLK